MTTVIRISWDAYKNTKSRTLQNTEHWTELEWAEDAAESAFLKSTPRWFLCKLNFESHCYKGWGPKVSQENSLPLAHRASTCTTSARLQLLPRAVAGAEAWGYGRVTKRTPLLQGSHQRERVANFVQNSLTSVFELSLEVRATAVE